MASKDSAINAARQGLSRNRYNRVAIYRIGSAWMYQPIYDHKTSIEEAKAKVQQNYKNTIVDFQEVTLIGDLS